MRSVSAESTADLARLHVLLPVRGLGDGKARLGSALDAEERESLILAMLRHSLAVLDRWEACRRVHVISRDRTVRAVAARAGASVLSEPEGSDLNGALRAGRAVATADGATAILCLPADLPLLSLEALGRLLDGADAAVAAGNGRPIVAVCPADARGGTNALLVSPPDVIEPSFGEASLEAHVRSAARAGATLQLILDPQLGFDLDTPEDLERLDETVLLELLRLGNESAVGAEPVTSAESR